MDLERQKFLFNQCDPKEPLEANDPRYEPFDERHLRGESARQRLLRTMRLSATPTTQLFTGLIGSGKSTELRRLADEARREGFFVAMANVVDREAPLIVRSHPLQVADVLFATCFAIDEALRGVGIAPHSRLDSLWDALTRDIGFEPALNLGFVQLKAKFTGEPGVREQLNCRERESPLAFKRGINRFVLQAQQVARDHELGRDLLVILDGLEKVADAAEVDAEPRENSLREVFLSNAEFVRLPCHAVYPVAPFMIQHAGEIGALYDAEPVMLPMVRIRDRKEKIDDAGVSGLLEVLRRRELMDAFSDESTARELVLASGGYLRDLLRLVREALQACPESDERIGGSLVEPAIRRIRRTYREGLFEEYRAPLRQARQHKSFDLNDDTRRLLGRLLRAHMLLRYHNDEEWYDVHPLLCDEIAATEA